MTLDIMFYQEGERNHKINFHYLLINVRGTMETIEYSKLLITCTYNWLDDSIKKSFNNFIHLFVTNDDLYQRGHKIYHKS